MQLYRICPAQYLEDYSGLGASYRDGKIETEFGNKYDLKMKAFHNGKQVSDGNMKDMNWTLLKS